jgi:hypothetical protein
MTKRRGTPILSPTAASACTTNFYFLDAELGLCYLRVPTWCPFRLKFYSNRRARLPLQLSQEQIA